MSEHNSYNFNVLIRKHQELNNDLQGLLDDINEAAIAPELWQGVAFKIEQFCPGGGVSFMFYDRVKSALPWEINTYEASRKKRYEEYYTHINSLWPVMQHQPLGTVADTDFFDAPNLIGHTEFYNEKGKLVSLLHHHKRFFDLKDEFK